MFNKQVSIMKNLKKFSAVALVATLAFLTTSCTKDTVDPLSTVNVATEQQAIQELLNTYGKALNASDAAAVTATYAQNGEVVAPGLPAALGSAQVRSTYEGIFKTISLTLIFTPAKTTVTSANYAFATTTSSGPVTVKATGVTTVQNYRELWAFVKENNQWKIAQYSFNQP